MTRNERKRKAAAKRLMLEQAVKEALALERERQRTSYDTHPCDTYETVRQRVSERVGVIQSAGGKRKFLSRDEKPLEPLKGDYKERRAVGYFGGKRLTVK